MAHYSSLNSGALFLAFNGVFYIAVDRGLKKWMDYFLVILVMSTN